MELIRVETKLVGDDTMLFKLRDGKSVEHTPYFEFKGKEHFFLGGFYYDLEPSLINHIFRSK